MKIHKIQHADFRRDTLPKIEKNDNISERNEPEPNSAIQNNSAS